MLKRHGASADSHRGGPAANRSGSAVMSTGGHLSVNCGLGRAARSWRGHYPSSVATRAFAGRVLARGRRKKVAEIMRHRIGAKRALS